MTILKDIIQRCHNRYAERGKLRQRRTVISPALYQSVVPYQIKVHCVRGNPMTLGALERADISFMPIGHAPENDQGPRDLGGNRFLRQQRIQDWGIKQWHTSWGIQIYTGNPSQRDRACWHDLEFKYDAICAAPEAVSTCIEALINMSANPLLTLTKSGGLRFSCRIQDYLHPNTDEAKYFIYKHSPTAENPFHRNVYLEIRGDEGYSRWDMRYEILVGDLLNPPVITKEVLFTPINILRAALHEPELVTDKVTEYETNTYRYGLPSFRSVNLDLSKEAFLRRGFSYERELYGYHTWTNDDLSVLSWEDQDTVWVRASTQNTDIPTRAVPITDIWDDSGISTQTHFMKKVHAIRERKLSPLAIKRLPQKLKKSQKAPSIYKTLEEHSTHLLQILKRDTRILAITTSDKNILTNTEMETFLLKNRMTCINIAELDAAEKRFRAQNQHSIARWRSIRFRWQQVKDIPENIRMANPFKHGNVCEDAERVSALVAKGGNAYESICTHCQVYTACQERGYLSQPLALQRANAQISAVGKLFLDPRHKHVVQRTLGTANDSERLCIIDETKTSLEKIFLQCEISKRVVEEWIVNWQGNALGNFAVALMNVLETEGDPYSNPIGQVRAVVEAFQPYAAEIIKQMCHLNVQGKIVVHGIDDPKTGTELARYAINFHGGATVYIPFDEDAEERLRDMDLHTLSLPSFTPHEDICIPMKMTQAIALGVLDIQSVEDISLFPTVCRDPYWTYWHQLQRFFTQYHRDVDAPMQLSDEYLKFWMPPMLHPDVKRLLLISTFLTEQQLHKIFPDEEMDVISIEPTSWVPGNKVFQIRTSSESINVIQYYDSISGTADLSKLGERYFNGIRTEIDRDLSIKHGIVTNKLITNNLEDLATKSNVSFVKGFKELTNIEVDIEEIQVLWIVGTPHWSQHFILNQAQMVYGSDKTPLNYEGELWTGHYKDERIQEVYNQNVVGLLRQIVGGIGLNRQSGKTVMLLTNFELPDITDREETILFDWEDFEVAGSLPKLEEAISIREQFEAESASITAESPREEVERVLGCSSRQANRVLNKLRGGNIPRVAYRDQILFLLAANREKTTSSLVAAMGCSPQSIGNQLKQLLDDGEIVRVRRGVYSLPETKK